MILIGASGHAKVIIDVLEKSGKSVDFLVDADTEISSLMNYEVRNENDYVWKEGEQLIISIGSNSTRKVLSHKYQNSFGTAIHPSAIIAGGVDIGMGTVVMASATVNSSTSLGKHCIINTSASIDHDCELGDYVHVSPNATLCGTIRIGEGTHVGAGAVIIPNLSIGKWVTIGAGTVVIEDIPDYAVVVGNPGKIIKYNDQKF